MEAPESLAKCTPLPQFFSLLPLAASSPLSWMLISTWKTRSLNSSSLSYDEILELLTSGLPTEVTYWPILL